MGRPMDDLHTPTVASGPVSHGYSNGDSGARSLQELMAQRDAIQAELQALGSVLDSHNVTMQTPLTTFDGYPRPDLDIAQIRTTRARIIHLKNDYKSLMAKIEEGLHKHWASAPKEQAPEPRTSRQPATTSHASATAAPASTASSSTAGIEAPFAKVNTVVPSSPADEAGLRAGDKITKFGHVNWMNHEKLSKVSQVVQQNEGREIAIKVLRSAEVGGGSQTLELNLVPRHNWGGRGMLGCHLLPL